MSFPSYVRSFDIMWLKYVSTMVSTFFSVLGGFFLVRLVRKNKLYKVRNVTLNTLRDMLAEGRNGPVYIELVEQEIFGVHAYHVSIPNRIYKGPWTTLSIFTKQSMANGFYTYVKYENCLMFTLLEGEDKTKETKFAVALLTKRPKGKVKGEFALREDVPDGV